MNEPVRWLDDAHTSQQLREVLGAASSSPPMPKSVHSKLAVVAAGLVAPGFWAKAAAAHGLGKSLVTQLSFGGVAKGVAALALIVGAGTTGYVTVGHRLNEEHSSQARTVRVAVRNDEHARRAVQSGPSSAVSETITETNSSQLTRPAQVAQIAPNQAPPVVAEPSGASAEPLGGESQPSIADEARLLETARGSLASDPTFALQVVKHHQSRYPDGQLCDERDLIAVDALLRLGRRDEALRRAAPRLEQNPDSLYARRLRKLLGNE